jgi:hypothetical protein
MFDQTPLNRLDGLNWSHRKSDVDEHKSENGGVRQLVADIAELVELQGRLMVDDVRSSLTAVVKLSLLTLCSAAIFLGTIPVILLAAANVLVSELQWSQHAAQFACGGTALLLVAVLLVWAYQLFKKCEMPLQQSMSELEKNLATLREMLVARDQTSAKSQSGSN